MMSIRTGQTTQPPTTTATSTTLTHHISTVTSYNGTSPTQLIVIYCIDTIHSSESTPLWHFHLCQHDCWLKVGIGVNCSQYETNSTATDSTLTCTTSICVTTTILPTDTVGLNFPSSTAPQLLPTAYPSVMTTIQATSTVTKTEVPPLESTTTQSNMFVTINFAVAFMLSTEMLATVKTSVNCL